VRHFGTNILESFPSVVRVAGPYCTRFCFPEVEAGNVWLCETSYTDVARTFHRRVNHRLLVFVVGGEKSLTKDVRSHASGGC
jgi:hypothetical protein